MFFIHDQSIFDPDLDMLAEVLAVIDAQLQTALQGWQHASEGSDELGFFDRAAHITGLGFVACQAYLTATYGFANVKKPDALAVGPCHTNGQTVVEIINHAANYWKHRDEWHLDKGPAHQERVRNAFDRLGFSVDCDYPLSAILVELGPELATLTSLVPKLEQWREQVRLISVCRNNCVAPSL